MPHILEQINEVLDDKSLVKCKGVSRMMSSIIEHQMCGKFVTTRVIQSYFKNPKKFGEDWRIVFKNLSLEKLNELLIMVKDFYKSVPSRLEENWSPMHIVAERGHLNFCKVFAKLTTLKRYEWSPLNFSAQGGHLEVSKFLYNELEDKKVRRIFEIGKHLAAKNGHLEIYKFLHETSNEIDEKTLMEEDITPLHLAAQYGNFEVCKYICDKNTFVAPFRSDTNTPLTLAFHRGHIKIARLLHERDDSPKPVIVMIFKLFCMLLCLFIFYDTCLFYPLLGTSRTFYDTMMFILSFILSWLPCPGIVIISNILKDVWFCFWTSPKLDY